MVRSEGNKKLKKCELLIFYSAHTFLTFCCPLILPQYLWFISPIDLPPDVFVPLVFPKVPLVDFVYLLFPIYSHFFGCLLH